MRIAFVIIALGGICGMSLSRAEADSPDARPSDQTQSLITKLADPVFHVRRDAAAQLRDIGAPALPALRDAAQGENPEIRTRASEIVHMLEYQPVPGRPMHAGYVRQRSIHARNVNGHKTVDVDDEGRKITITEDDDGIKMTVAGETDGKHVSRTYTARTPEQLRSENPEAFAVYQRFSAAGGDEDVSGIGGNVIVQQGNVIVLQRFQPAAVILPQADDLNGLRERLDKAMDKANVPPLQRARVHNAIDRVEQTQGFNGLVAPPDAVDDGVAQYDKACDDLRKILSDNHLPDPGDALPPPKSSRLGVNVQQDLVSGGIIVRHVLPHSRADHIGLQDDDLLRKINGRDVQDVKELRRLVTEHPKGIVVDVTRDGREMRLEEPK